MSANMFSHRALQLTARRLAAANPSALSKSSSLTRLASPAAIATGHVQYRQTSTAPTTSQSGDAILAAQRLNRPVAPHLSIYRPQITWYLSALNRITGVMISGPMYLFGLAYLVAPTLGWHLESASLAASFAALPLIVQVILKMGVAWPFAFHSWNGIRHLTWDTGAAFTNKQVIVTGWTVVGLSVASALALTFL